MPDETIFAPANFDFANLTATVHEHDVPPGAPPTTIIRTDQDWSVHVNFDNVGAATGMIGGQYDLHVYLESIGPGVDHNLTEAGDHLIPLAPGIAPINYNRHIDIPAGVVTAPADGAYLAKLVFSVTYRDLTGAPGPVAAYVEGPVLQFYNP